MEQSGAMKRTVAEELGRTPHLSPLLHKTRRLGLESPNALLRLAVRRGCTHYAPPDFDAKAVRDPGRERLSDTELAVALCSGAQEYDPMLVRCAAQLLGAPDVSSAELVRLARRERCEQVIRHIAQAAAEADVGREVFWHDVMDRLPAIRAPHAGLLPHSSRFMVQTGIAGPRQRGSSVKVWLRPVPTR